MSNAYRSVLESGGVTPTGDAVVADVLAGKTFSNANAVGLTGTMVNRGAVSQTLSGGQSYTIPEGYHNGSGSVTATPATATTGNSIAGASVTLRKANCAIVSVLANSGGTISYSGSGTIKKNQWTWQGGFIVINNPQENDTVSISSSGAWSHEMYVTYID